LRCSKKCDDIWDVEKLIRVFALLTVHDLRLDVLRVCKKWDRAVDVAKDVRRQCQTKMLHDNYSKLEQTLIVRTHNIRRVLFGYKPPEVNTYQLLQLLNCHYTPRILSKHRAWVSRHMEQVTDDDIVLFMPWWHHVVNAVIHRCDNITVAYALYFNNGGKSDRAQNIRNILLKGKHGNDLRKTIHMMSDVERNIVRPLKIRKGRLPYNTDVWVNAVTHVKRIRSASAPHAITLDTSNGEIQILVKSTDVRKDRCTMVICKVLQRMGIRCVAYPVLVTDNNGGGWIQMLPAKTLYELGNNLSMHIFNQYPHTPPTRTRSTFRKSVVGSCILSHLIGVGDRHLQNMVCHNGEIVHIDFSYMLGHDPKMPQPLRVTTPMIEMMGGKDGNCYQTFLEEVQQAFQTIAQHGPLWCTLLENVAHEELYDLTAVRQHVERQINVFPEDIVDIVRNHSDTWAHTITDLVHGLLQMKLLST
jgi:hypothetical protein|tara:strand:- start:285 stop:1700 length:1416 start_codon:yes stop_codon:yes gene_type:complete